MQKIRSEINPTAVTLCENSDFRRLYHRGKFKATGAVVTYVSRGRGGIRYGITASKKIGNSPVRSRARRVITAAFRSVLQQKKLPNVDIVFVARAGIEKKKSSELERAIKRHLDELLPQLFSK